MLVLMDDIGFRLETADLLARLALGREMESEMAPLVKEALELARPRACYRIGPVAPADGEMIEIDGWRFESHILKTNLSESGEAGLFVATCGMELERWAEAFDDVLLRWAAEEICELALAAAVGAVEGALDAALPGPHHATMNPGSLPDWPLQQQAVLFESLGDVRGAAGVELTPSFLMRPRKSVSGIRFASHTAYSNCRICPRENCRGRRMPYDEMEYERRYGRSSALAPTCAEADGGRVH